MSHAPKQWSLALALVSTVQVAPAYADSSDGISIPEGGFALYLRDAFLDPSVISSPKNSPGVLAKHPFKLSYQSDEMSGDEVFSASGAIFGQWRNYHVDKGALKISAYSFGVELDQTAVNGAISRDTLEIRAGGTWLFQDSRPNDVFFRSHYLSTSVGWLTNREFDLSVLSVDAQYQPIGESFGFGGAPYRVGNFRLKFTPVLTAEYLNVIDADGRPNFVGLDDALFVGGSIGFSGSFAGALKPVSIDAKYSVSHDVIGAGGTKEEFKAGLGWALTESGLASFRLDYVKGDTPTSDEADKLTIGVGFAF